MRLFSRAARAAKSARGNAGPSRSSAKILVVEDARCVQKSVGLILAKIGLKADMADDGEAACRMAEQSRASGAPYELILMDVQMPKMNGLQAAQWLREHGWKCPIVAVSVYEDRRDHAEFLKAGCDECVVKPVTEATLRGLYARYLKR